MEEFQQLAETLKSDGLWAPAQLKYVPCSEFTMAPKGAKEVKIKGVDDKRPLSVEWGSSPAGNILPFTIAVGSMKEKDVVAPWEKVGGPCTGGSYPGTFICCACLFT